MNNNIGSTITKVAALAGGAIVGTILANLLDKLISAQIQEHPDYDKGRYAQGLTPVMLQPPISNGQQQ